MGEGLQAYRRCLTDAFPALDPAGDLFRCRLAPGQVGDFASPRKVKSQPGTSSR